MNKIDVQRPASDVLQRCSHEGHLGEILMIMTEIHKGCRQQQEFGHRQRHNSPRHSHEVPLQGIHRTENHQHNQYGEEPLAVHNALGLLPIAMYDIAVQEEGEIEKHLSQTGVHQEMVEFRLGPFVALCPREILGLVATLIKQ